MSRGELVHDGDRFHTLCEGLRRTRGTLVTSPRCHRLPCAFLGFVDHNTAWFIGIPWAVTSCPCWAEPNWKGSRTRVILLGVHRVYVTEWKYRVIVSVCFLRLCKISINCIAFFKIILHSSHSNFTSIDMSNKFWSTPYPPRIYALIRSFRSWKS